MTRALSRTAGIVALAVIGLAGAAPVAWAADPLDVAPPTDPVRWDYGFETHITDHALYFATGVHVADDPRALVLVWRRTLHQTPDGLVIGNAHVLGTARNDGALGSMIQTSDDAAIWSDGPTGRLMVNDASDITTAITSGASPVPQSLGGTWYVTDGTLHSIAAPTTTVTLLGSAGDAWPTWADYSIGVSRVAVADTAVAWLEEATGYPDGVYHGGLRLYVQDLDGSGLVGEPRLVAENLDLSAGGSAPGFLQVSDDYVAWLTYGPGDASGLSWTSVSDTADTVHTTSVHAYTYEFVLDGTRAALEGTGDDGFRTTQVDLATSVKTAIGPTSALLDDLHGDLLAYLDPQGDLRTLRVVSLSAATSVTLLHHFPDVSGYSPFLTHIDRLALDGITTGYPDGTFRPAASVTREAMAAFLYRQAGEPAFTPPATSPFTDVSTGHPFYAEICWLADTGISTGWDNGDGTASFRPGAPVSREAMAAFLYRFGGATFTGPESSPFTDVSTGHPFYDAIAWMADAGISTGWASSGGAQFRPGANIERQAMAAFLVRLADLTR